MNPRVEGATIRCGTSNVVKQFHRSSGGAVEPAWEMRTGYQKGGHLTGARFVHLGSVAHQHRVLIALTVSILLHVTLLTLDFRGPNPPPQTASPPMMVQLHPYSPQLIEEGAGKSNPTSSKGKTNTRRDTIIVPTGASSPVADVVEPDRSGPDTPEAATVSVAPPLNLSMESLAPAVRKNMPQSLAQAARDQLGIAGQSSSTALAKAIAEGAVPECLRNSQDGQGGEKPVVAGGLFALPQLAYSAITGKCK